MDGYRGCGYAEAVFYDDRQLWRVDTRDELAPGRFFEDYDANAIWIADDPSQRTVEVARTEAAVTGESKDVLVEGLIIEKFANPAQRGAVHARAPVGGYRIMTFASTTATESFQTRPAAR